MTNMRTTVILKTDIVDSTPRAAAQTQAELGFQRKQHKQFISEIAVKNHGSVLQEEGDAYWITFPSVTTAVLAAIEMHQNLRETQVGRGEKQRLAIRAIIAVGDILFQETDVIGTTLALTARIEKITPSDQIYLSHAAWLILNKAEVQTSYVGEYQFKGFSELEKVYKINQKYGIRVLTDQFIVFVDAKGFGKFSRRTPVEDVEKFLLEYDDLINDVCSKHNGIVRQVNGDMYFLTFTEAEQVISALQFLCMKWQNFVEKFNIGVSIGVHRGNLNVFRSFVFGNDINTSGSLSDISISLKSGQNLIFVATSGKVRDQFAGTEKEGMFMKLSESQVTEARYKSIINEHRVYQLRFD